MAASRSPELRFPIHGLPLSTYAMRQTIGDLIELSSHQPTIADHCTGAQRRKFERERDRRSTEREACRRGRCIDNAARVRVGVAESVRAQLILRRWMAIAKA